MILQHAIQILSLEKSMSCEERKHHIKHIREYENPYIVDSYVETITTTDDLINDLDEGKLCFPLC